MGPARRALALAGLLVTMGTVAEGQPLPDVHTESLAPPHPATEEPRVMDVHPHPQPLSLLEDSDPRLAANKRLVFDMWRSIVNAGHVELADAMLEEDYIQHSPVLPTGRAAFKQIFSAVKRRTIPELVTPPLVTILAEGDRVIMALREELPEPSGNGNYSTTHFNMFRIENGRLAEHWHSIQDTPGANVLSPDKGGPQRVNGLTGDERLTLLSSHVPALAANKRLAFEAWQALNGVDTARSLRQLLAADYVEHDPNIGPSRDELAMAIAGRGGASVEQAPDAPLVAIVAQGDLVTIVTARIHPYPGRPRETYTTSWFDMYRIAQGKIAEHWTGTSKPGTPPQQYGN